MDAITIQLAIRWGRELPHHWISTEINHPVDLLAYSLLQQVGKRTAECIVVVGISWIAGDAQRQVGSYPDFRSTISKWRHVGNKPVKICPGRRSTAEIVSAYKDRNDVRIEFLDSFFARNHCVHAGATDSENVIFQFGMLELEITGVVPAVID